MTLTELRYIVAVARERHFGHAAEACFVSQPTLSVAVKKLEDELGITLFERNSGDITVTPIGQRIVEQAQRVLEETAVIKQIAAHGKDQLASPVRLGVIFTIGPYLLPDLIPALRNVAPQMPLLIEENYTSRLAELLKQGDIDLAILALPFDEPGIVVEPLYDEPFRVIMPLGHPWEKQQQIEPELLVDTNDRAGAEPPRSGAAGLPGPELLGLFFRRPSFDAGRQLAHHHSLYGRIRQWRKRGARHLGGRQMGRRTLAGYPPFQRAQPNPPGGAGMAQELSAPCRHRSRA